MTPLEKKLEFDHPLLHVVANTGDVEYRFTREAVEKLDAEAFERGRQDGEERLGQRLVELRKEVAERQAGLLESLRQAHCQVADECEQALIELGVAVAAKLVAGIEIDRDQVAAAITEAVAQFEDCAEYEISLHPKDLALFDPSDHAQNEKFKLQSSAEVTRGGCVVRTAFGSVDARRETKLTLLKEALHP